MAANSGRPFVPGDSRTNRLGPVGKHGLGFAARVRAATGDGKDVLDFVLRLLRGEVMDDVPVKGESGVQVVQVVAPSSVRLRAAMWLAERGHGKALENIPDEDSAGTLSEEDLLAAIFDSLHGNPRMLAFAQKRLQSVLASQQVAGGAQ